MEFAIIFLVLMMLVFGAVDLGRVFHALVVTTNAAREGARYGVVHYGMATPYSRSAYFGSITSRTQSEAQNSGIAIGASNILVTCTLDTQGTADTEDDTCRRQLPIRVTVSHNVNLLMGWILPSPIQLVRYAEMMIP